MGFHAVTVRIINADVLEGLAALPDESVHCVVTSPPYWGLRDYGVPGQIGLEPTLGEHVERMVEVFREVRRVLRKDGTLWLNYGDCYATSVNGRSAADTKALGEDDRTFRDKPFSTVGPVYDPSGGPKGGGYRGNNRHNSNATPGGRICAGGFLKPKDLCGVPWRLALALQQDGWVLRQEIIWSKANPMPESVKDRCTKAHEQIFLFAKAKWVGPQPGSFSYICDEDARWLAALVDAEGSIVVKRTKHAGRADTFAPQVSFGSTSRALIEAFVAIAGYGSIIERRGKNAPMLYWQVANNVARAFLERIYPWLIVKQRQARIGIHLDDLTYYRGGKRPERKCRTEAEGARLISLWERNKQCNRFGDPDLSDVPEPEYGRWSDCERYYFDAKAIEEPSVYVGISGMDSSGFKDPCQFNGKNAAVGKNGRIPMPKVAGWQQGALGHGHSTLDHNRVPAARAENERPRKGCPNGRASGNKSHKYVQAYEASDTEEHRTKAGLMDIADTAYATRNKRSVWEVATSPYPDAHFATFPPALIEPCIKAGTSERGCCSSCGAPWVRETKRIDQGWDGSRYGERAVAASGGAVTGGTAKSTLGSNNGKLVGQTETLGWSPSCKCDAPIARCTVLDPFGGSGTTGLVADRLGRNAVLVELNPEYAAMAEKRIKGDAPLFTEVCA